MHLVEDDLIMLRPNGLQVLPGETTNPKIEQIEVRNVEALLLSQEGNRTKGRGATCPPETMATFSFDYCWVFNHHEHPSTKEISLLRLHFFPSQPRSPIRFHTSW